MVVLVEGVFVSIRRRLGVMGGSGVEVGLVEYFGGFFGLYLKRL